MFDIDPAGDANDKKIFFLHVRSHMIGLRILGSLDKASLKSVKMKEKMYLWQNSAGERFYDGPTMLQICIEKVSPSTRVGVSQLKETLHNIKASSFGYNVCDLPDKMDVTYREILQRGSTHDDYIMDVFNALLTVKNSIFHGYIQREKDKWDTGIDIEPDALITDAVTKYNNMVAKKEWKETEPSNAKLAALTTELNELKEKFVLVTQKGVGSSSGSTDNKSKSNKSTVAPWRMSKTLGNKVEKDGKTWHWCHKQHNDGKGMYVTHHPDNHTEWQERKEKFRRDKKEKTNDSKSDSSKQAGSSDSSKKTLALSDKLKAAMVTKFCCSADDAEKLWSEVAKQSN